MYFLRIIRTRMLNTSSKPSFASMKKKMVYTCYIRLSSLGYIYLPNVVALQVLTEDVMMCVPLCFILIHFIKTKLNNSKQCNDESSCTSKPCKWNIPSKRKGEVEPISNMKFRKHDEYRIYPCISRTFFHEKLLPKRGCGLSTETLEKTSREDT